jgi:hypothetical protein
MGGEWKPESAAAQDVDQTWNRRERRMKDTQGGDKNDDEAHDRNT